MARKPPAPEPKPRRASIPTIVPDPAPPEAGSLAFYEASLRQIDKILTTTENAAAYAALVRQKHLAAEKIAELRAIEQAKTATHLSPAERIARLGEMVHHWPEMALEVAVAEYLERKGYQLWDPRTGGVIGPELAAKKGRGR